MRGQQQELYGEVRGITKGLLQKPLNLFDYANFIEHIQFAENQKPVLLFKKKRMETMTSTIYKFDPKAIRQADIDTQNEIQILNHNLEQNI